MAMNRAVLWDMDGTLVDSAELHWQAWRDSMSREGFPVTHGQFLATFGQRNDSILRQWLGEKATPELIQRIGNAKEALYRQHVREHGIAPLPGALEWVNLRSLDLLDANAFNRLLQDGASSAVTHVFPFHQ